MRAYDSACSTADSIFYRSVRPQPHERRQRVVEFCRIGLLAHGHRGDWSDGAANTAHFHGYAITGNERFALTMLHLVSLPEGFVITGISFYGLNPATVPETGSTLLLAGIGLIGIIIVRSIVTARSGGGVAPRRPA
jgi:hypothetical protein